MKITLWEMCGGSEIHLKFIKQKGNLLLTFIEEEKELGLS